MSTNYVWYELHPLLLHTDECSGKERLILYIYIYECCQRTRQSIASDKVS